MKERKCRMLTRSKRRKYFTLLTAWRFRRDLWLLFEAGLTLPCLSSNSQLASPPGCCVFFVATGWYLRAGLRRALWLQPRRRLPPHHGLLPLPPGMVRYSTHPWQHKNRAPPRGDLVLWAKEEFVRLEGERAPVLWPFCLSCDSRVGKFSSVICRKLGMERETLQLGHLHHTVPYKSGDML